MFSTLTYFFGHPVYFACLCHVNPLCKHKKQNLQMKESSNQKMQENKHVLKLKNTGKKVYQKLKCKKNMFAPSMAVKDQLDITQSLLHFFISNFHETSFFMIYFDNLMKNLVFECDTICVFFLY